MARLEDYRKTKIPVQFCGQKEKLLNEMLDESEHGLLLHELQPTQLHGFLIVGFKHFYFGLASRLSSSKAYKLKKIYSCKVLAWSLSYHLDFSCYQKK